MYVHVFALNFITYVHNVHTYVCVHILEVYTYIPVKWLSHKVVKGESVSLEG